MSDSEAGEGHVSNEEASSGKPMDGEEMDDDQRIDTLFNSFTDWCDAQGERGVKIADGYQRLLGELDYLKLSSEMSVERQRASVDEIKELDKLLTSMEKEVVEVKEVIAGRHLELKEAKKTRPNKMKRTFSSLPDPNISMGQLERMESDIKTLKLKKEALQKAADEREKQLHVFLTSTRELKHKFRKELEEWEEAVKDINF